VTERSGDRKDPNLQSGEIFLELKAHAAALWRGGEILVVVEGEFFFGGRELFVCRVGAGD